MRGNRDIFSGKSIYNRETISRQEHRISDYRIKIFPHNELVHLPYIAVATNTSRLEGEEQLLIGIVLERWRLEITQDHLTCYRNNGSKYYRWTISLFCIH